MTTISSSVTIRAPVDRVWGIVSDLDGEPRFWKGTKSVRNVSERDGKLVREVIIAFRDQKCMQEVTVEPKTAIRAVFTEGIIEGTKTVTLEPAGDKTKLDVVWEIRLAGMMGMFTGMIKKHIKNGTEQAIDNIRREAES